MRWGILSCEILGTSIACTGTAMSKSLKTSTSWSTSCGTGTSRTCTMGAKSASCSTVCRCTRSCGRGSAKAAAEGPRLDLAALPLGSSSNNWNSSGWRRGGGEGGGGVRGFPDHRRVVRLVFPLPDPVRPLTS